MIKFLFPRRLMINSDNIPHAFLANALSCLDGETGLVVYTTFNSIDFAGRFLRSLGFHFLVDGDVLTVSQPARLHNRDGANTLNTLAAELGVQQAAQADVVAELRRQQVDQAAVAPQAARVFTTEVRVNPGVNIEIPPAEPVINPANAAWEMTGAFPQDRENEEGTDQEERGIQEGQVQFELFRVPYASRPVSREGIVSMLPMLMGGSDGSQAALYLTKVREFNRLWSNVVDAKRQIDQLIAVIESGDMLKKIESDIAFLSEKCPIVDSVELGEAGHCLIITTKEIITEKQPLFGARRVGRLQIKILLQYIYGRTPPDTNYIKSFSIINLDRCPHGWVCGHAFINENRVFEVCLGGYFNHIFEAIVSRNLPLFFDTIIRFVQNPNERDAWGRKIELFPEVKDEA